MSRVGPLQPDLFARPSPPSEPRPPECPPVQELADMLALLREADRMPWPSVPAVMAQEHRVMHWARLAGAQGAALASAIMDEIERLFAEEERRQLAAAQRCRANSGR